MNSLFNIKSTLIFASVMAILLLTAPYLLAAGSHDHGHDQHAEEEATGPHGGKLLTQGDFALEITIVEKGIPPEMRIFPYQNGEAVAPQQVELEILLHRLGGQTDRLTFIPEQGYLVSQQEIKEPHSFEVEVKALIMEQPLKWYFESFEGRTEISARMQKLANLKTGVAGPRELQQSETLFGVIAPMQNKQFTLVAPYAGVIEKLHVVEGSQVKKGQTLAVVRNPINLQTYSVKSPANGQVVELVSSVGGMASPDQPLLTLIDLTNVWVNLSAFPQHLQTINLNQPVRIMDSHNDYSTESYVSYVSPVMTGGHVARVRADVSNLNGHWRPGMHVKAQVQTQQKKVPLAVKLSALQTYRDMPVVFAKYGNHYEVRMVELGEQDGEYVEVLSGLKPGTEYVTENSFVLKADVMKDGAKHAH